MSISLNHFSIRTTDLAATRAFYVDLLGLQEGPRPQFDFPGYWLYQGPTDSYANAAVHVIGIDPVDRSGLHNYLGERDPAKLKGSGAVDHVAFFATDLVGTLARLHAAGIEPRQRTVPGVGLHQLFLQDPSDVVIELNFAAEEKHAMDRAAASSSASA